MGKTTAQIVLTNALDWLRHAATGDGAAEEPLRQVALTAHVDTGSTELCLPADVVQQLGLREITRTTMVLADETTREAIIAGPVHLTVLGRSMLGQALVLPEGAEPLLGAIPLESLDLVVDPHERALLVADERGPRSSVKPMLSAT